MRDHPTKDRRPSRGSTTSSGARSAPKPGARPPRGKGPPRSPEAETKPARESATSFRQPRKKITLKASTGEAVVGSRQAPIRNAGARPRSGSVEKRLGHGDERKPSRGRDFEAASLEADVEMAGGTAQRIAKVMARAGACSRRDAEGWIAEGRVALNGVVLTNPAINVGDNDKITVDGEPLAHRARTRLFLFHKPRGLVTTERDPEGRPTIFDYLREHWPEGPRVVSIGRLDINTEGLLLLTNDGGLARVLELPSTGWVRRYRVRAKGETDQGVLDRLRQGVSVEGVDYAGIEATLDREQGANSWLTMGLREGKNREIKRVLDHIGLTVNRLIRLSFGPFQLGELAEGAVEEVRTRVLRDQLGPSLAEAAGVDFLSPLGDVANTPERLEPLPQKRPRTSEGSDRGEGGIRRTARSSRESGPRGRALREARPSEREPPVERKVKPAPRPRKHVSALRADEGAGPIGPRKRIERRETADRSGRTVHVEHLVPAKSRDAKRAKGQDERLDRRPPPTTRNGRRFEAERKDRDAQGARPTRRADGAATTEGPRGPKRERRQSSSEMQKPSSFVARKSEPGRTPAPARYSAKPRTEYEGERGRPKAGALADRPPVARRFDEQSRSARPKDKVEARRPARAKGPRNDEPRSAEPRSGGFRSGRPKGGGKAGGGGGPPRGAGAGKGRPRGK